MKIAVYGASGFTGGLVVAELIRRGRQPVLVGRDEIRLRAVAGGAEVRVAGLDDIPALARAFDGCAAVVNCAGPFSRWGEPVIRAALAAGCHYVDTTGEMQYLHAVLSDVGPDAERAGVTVVPGLADDGGPGDLIAHLTAARVPDVADLLIADLRSGGGASRGTARSMVAVLGTGPLEYADGNWHPAEMTSGATILVPSESDPVPVQSFALPGVATIPRHVAAGRVRSAIRAETAAMFAGLTADIVESVPEVVDAELRAAGRWLMLAEATAGDGARARGWVTGPDSYGLTAVIAVEGALRLAAGGSPAGALPPALAFEPADFLDFLTAYGVTWKVE
ncbi:saccharopine dehydrogenase family protein [Nocardia sp. alder85J]|uniref:saccharopine dehydrogenase family protein n=1 Tax=Nocardia sp. alder85J TaxID=2862949 RepID=UPI001CD7B9EA|nr:saccharopine dehydrogenase NADP-binding domain-containing protein [Nocardia sp. alder85J]MCX4094375.1 saccharopine dehydrogenase NADP-binding domain-containing protein [Nocardia sp. alder85J]